MARDPVMTLGLYGILTVAGYQLVTSGAFDGGNPNGKNATGVRNWWRRARGQQPTGGGAGQSQSSGTTTGSPSTQAPAPPQNQQQPSGTTAYTGPNSFQGGSGANAACQLVIQGFVQAYQLDPSDHTSPWVVYYQQQFGSWPDNDLCVGRDGTPTTNPADLYNYAVNAIGWLQQIGVM